MIRISQIKLNIQHSTDDLIKKVEDLLHISSSDLLSFSISRRSLDARDKKNIHYVYSVDVSVRNEKSLLKRHTKNNNIRQVTDNTYRVPEKDSIHASFSPVVVGAGPAGLFCAYLLAYVGLKPHLIEQGENVDDRCKSVENFWNGNSELDPHSNIQFGEGGAGTFSDGKLVSGVKDIDGRKTFVMDTFHKHGAPESVTYDAKPHVGTDILKNVIKSMRFQMIEWGATVSFNTKLTGLEITDGKVSSAILHDVCDNSDRTVSCSDIVLAIGHSSRDTFRMLNDAGVKMIPKPFAVGVRAEHIQEEINCSQYGENYRELYGNLPPADYKLTFTTSDGHAVYSFCMCPGGYVVNSSSEPGRLCVNGMSYSGRSGVNANSAIVVSISPDDINAGSDPMAAIRFQQDLEAKAFKAGEGRIPVQRLEDFISGKVTTGLGHIFPETKGNYTFADINSVLPAFISEDIKEAFCAFSRQIKGYDDPDVILSAVESRTSSPVRIVRDEHYESVIKGLYPCGEGAGYAGGITSAAIDGIRIFEELCRKYKVIR